MRNKNRYYILDRFDSIKNEKEVAIKEQYSILNTGEISGYTYCNTPPEDALPTLPALIKVMGKEAKKLTLSFEWFMLENRPYQRTDNDLVNHPDLAKYLAIWKKDYSACRSLCLRRITALNKKTQALKDEAMLGSDAMAVLQQFMTMSF